VSLLAWLGLRTRWTFAGFASRRRLGCCWCLERRGGVLRGLGSNQWQLRAEQLVEPCADAECGLLELS
jgi:hypothetical protein